MGVVGLAENKANSVPLELELWLSLAKVDFLSFLMYELQKWIENDPVAEKHFFFNFQLPKAAQGFISYLAFLINISA